MNRQPTAVLIALLLAATLVGAAVAPATASHAADEGGGLSDALSADDGGYLSAAANWASGFTSRVSHAISGPEHTATESRDAMVEAFNEHNDSLVSYANDRGIHEEEVARVDCTLEGETATAYIVADYNSTAGQYDSAQAVTSTDRSVDHDIVLSSNACDNAADEIETFHEEFAATGDDVSAAYLSRVGGEYGDNIQQPFTEDK